MNAPERFEIFLLPDDEKKVEILGEVAGMPNSCVFKINREDHTIGNMLKMELHKSKSVIFVGYKQPHPLQPHLELYIQTTMGVPAADVLNSALSNLITEIGRIKSRFGIESGLKKAQASIEGNNDNPFSTVPNRNRKIDYFPTRDKNQARTEYVAREMVNDPYQEAFTADIPEEGNLHSPEVLPQYNYRDQYQTSNTYPTAFEAIPEPEAEEEQEQEQEAEAEDSYLDEFFGTGDDKKDDDSDPEPIIKKEKGLDPFHDVDF